MTISGLNRGAPKDIMNGLLMVRWLPPAAAGCSARRGRSRRSSTHPLYCAGLVAHKMCTTALPYSQNQQPAASLLCSPQPAAWPTMPPEPDFPTWLTDMASPSPSTGKLAAAFNGLMEEEGPCECMRKVKKRREQTNALRNRRTRCARSSTVPPPPRPSPHFSTQQHNKHHHHTTHLK